MMIEQWRTRVVQGRRDPRRAGCTAGRRSGARQSVILASAGAQSVRSRSMTAPVPWLKPSQTSPSRFSSEMAV